MLRNIKNKIYFALGLFAQTITATTESAVIDTKDLKSLAFLLNVGTMAFDGSNYLTVKIMESDNNSDFTEATVANDGLYEAMPVLNSTSEDDSQYLLEYRGNKRYVKLRLEETGTVSVAIAISAVGIPEVSQ